MGKSIFEVHSFNKIKEVKQVLKHISNGSLNFWEKNIFVNERFLNLQIRAVFFDGGNINALAIGLYDVTALQKRKQSHDNLFRMYTLMVENTPLIMLTINNEGRITSLNTAAEKLWELKREKAINQNIIDLLFNGEKFDSNGNYTSILLETLETGIEYRSLKRDVCINKNEYIVLYDTCVLRDPAGKVLGVLGVLKDITEYDSKEMEVKRQEKYDILSQIAAGLADEMRNPLTTVKGFMQLLNDKMKKTRQKEYVELALDELKRIEQLVRNFLLFFAGCSKLKIGKYQPHH